jgi:ATP-dependent DNA ligase
VADFTPARLQLVKQIPKGHGWLYEPKCDGYRGLLMTNGAGQGAVFSRNAKNLSAYFPELVHLAQTLPRGSILDGEIVKPTENGVSFFELQHRLAVPIRQRPSVAAHSPVAFVAFDILQEKSEDIRRLLLAKRRKRLERLTSAARDPLLQLIVQVDDPEVARAWLHESITGIEGVVAKRDEPYPNPTARRWQKVRRESTIDVLVQGFVGEPGSSLRLVIGRRHGDETRILGTTWPIAVSDARALFALMPSAVPGERPIWTPFVKERIDEWFRLPTELVAEVVVTNIDGDTLRHPARFVRWRMSEPPELLRGDEARPAS